jgi:hypothetical protein
MANEYIEPLRTHEKILGSGWRQAPGIGNAVPILRRGL